LELPWNCPSNYDNYANAFLKNVSEIGKSACAVCRGATSILDLHEFKTLHKCLLPLESKLELNVKAAIFLLLHENNDAKEERRARGPHASPTLST
jgi:hypothetical protein